MSLPLFYPEPGGIDTDTGVVVIVGDEARHLAGSLRAREGESMSIADGFGWVYRVRLDSVQQKRVEARIISTRYVEPEKPAVVLLQALCRPRHLEEAIARAAESGVSVLIPFEAPRSEAAGVERVEKRASRLRRIARESSKVARRSRPLEVRDHVGWPPEGELSRRDLNLVLWESETQGLREILPPDRPESIGLVTGPEGGFSVNDIGELSRLGAIAVSLGDLVHRAESAGSYAAMLIRYHYRLLE
jgi:16S rRNA (uracil1498-N3)-methyltransferase